MRIIKALGIMVAMSPLLVFAQPSQGSAVSPTPQEQQNLDAIKGKASGVIVWSTSRANARNDIWKMNMDGTDQKSLTQGDGVDWFPRISPDGKWVLFNRSNSGWVPENDADQPDQWDLWVIGMDGQGERKVVEKATWGTWRPDSKTLIYSRASKVFSRSLEGTDESMLLDGELAFKKGVILQEPNLSPDGKFLAITLRGSQRETGIWSLDAKSWQQSGEGCQIDWVPGGKQVYRVNSTGNGGSAAPSEILRFPFENGKQVGKVGFFGVSKEFRLMDLPGRRSHEYFPRIDNTGSWLVWGATDKGHDHDIYDYEIYVWKIGSPVEQAARVTFHSGNDRWPDMWVP
jgi:Tol biopolymer transport system component